VEDLQPKVAQFLVSVRRMQIQLPIGDSTRKAGTGPQHSAGRNFRRQAEKMTPPKKEKTIPTA